MREQMMVNHLYTKQRVMEQGDYLGELQMTQEASLTKLMPFDRDTLIPISQVGFKIPVITGWEQKVCKKIDVHASCFFPDCFNDVRDTLHEI